MIRKTLSGVIAVAMLSSLSAVAEDTVSGNISLVSDYSFRGISQTSLEPAIQGGFDLATDSGLIFGVWSSNVSFGSTSQELDIYVGGSFSVADDITVDAVFTRFEYPSAGNAFDYNEFGVSASMDLGTFGIVYSNNYLNVADTTWFYPYIDFPVPLGNENYAIDVHVGHNMADNPIFGGQESYWDYSVTLTVPYGGADFALAVVGTDVSEMNCRSLFSGGSPNQCDHRIIGSISKSF